jgi:hypothetical protein
MISLLPRSLFRRVAFELKTEDAEVPSGKSNGISRVHDPSITAVEMPKEAEIPCACVSTGTTFILKGL